MTGTPTRAGRCPGESEEDMTSKYTTVKTAEMWAKVQSMGTYEQDYKNGELWSFNGELYYLSNLSLDTAEMREVTAYFNGLETI